MGAKPSSQPHLGILEDFPTFVDLANSICEKCKLATNNQSQFKVLSDHISVLKDTSQLLTIKAAHSDMHRAFELLHDINSFVDGFIIDRNSFLNKFKRGSSVFGQTLTYHEKFATFNLRLSNAIQSLTYIESIDICQYHQAMLTASLLDLTVFRKEFELMDIDTNDVDQSIVKIENELADLNLSASDFKMKISSMIGDSESKSNSPQNVQLLQSLFVLRTPVQLNDILKTIRQMSPSSMTRFSAVDLIEETCNLCLVDKLVSKLSRLMIQLKVMSSSSIINMDVLNRVIGELGALPCMSNELRNQIQGSKKQSDASELLSSLIIMIKNLSRRMLLDIFDKINDDQLNNISLPSILLDDLVFMSPTMLEVFSLDFEAQIAAAGHSTVYRTRSAEYGVCALKCINRNEISMDLRNFRREVMVQQRIYQESIVKVFACNLDESWILMELGLYNLEYLVHVQDHYITEPDMIEFFMQIFNGISYLHDLKLIHRDIKPTNMIVFPNKVVKIAGFGQNKVAENASVKSHDISKECICYMAPELLLKSSMPAPFSFSSDIYALMVSLNQCLTKQIQYSSGMSGTAELTIVDKLEYIPVNAIRQLIIDGLNPDPIRRPPINKCLERFCSVLSPSNVAADAELEALPVDQHEIYEILLTRAKLRRSECLTYSSVLSSRRVRSEIKLRQQLEKNSNFLFDVCKFDEDDVDDIIDAVEYTNILAGSLARPESGSVSCISSIDVVDCNQLMYEFLKLKAGLRNDSCIKYTEMLCQGDSGNTPRSLIRTLEKEPSFLSQTCHLDFFEMQDVIIALHREYSSVEKRSSLSSLPLEYDHILELKKWLKQFAKIDGETAYRYARHMVRKNVLTLTDLEMKLSSDPGFLFRDCSVQNIRHELVICQELHLKTSRELVEISTAEFLKDIHQQCSEIAARKQPWSGDSELVLFTRSCFVRLLNDIGAISGGNKTTVEEVRGGIMVLMPGFSLTLRSMWENEFAKEIDQIMSQKFREIAIKLDLTNAETSRSSLDLFIIEMGQTVVSYCDGFGQDEYFAQLKRIKLAQLEDKKEGIRKVVEKFSKTASKRKDAVELAFHDLELRISRIRSNEIDNLSNSSIETCQIFLDRLKEEVKLETELSDLLVRTCMNELCASINDKRNRLRNQWDAFYSDWRNSACASERECRLVVVEIMKQTRIGTLWNLDLDWLEDVQMGQWSPQSTHGDIRQVVLTVDGMLRELIVVRFGLAGCLPIFIGSLRSLTVLDFSNNEITAIPNTIADLRQLKELRLGNNRLEFLPDTIGELKALSLLDLHENSLQVLPISLGDMTSLRFLQVRSNRLTSLPFTIGNLSLLNQLDITNNNINEFPAGISELLALQKLFVYGNPIAPQDVESLPSKIELTNLKVFTKFIALT